MNDYDRRLMFFAISLLAIFMISIICWYLFKPSYQTFVIYTPYTVSGLLPSAPVEFKGVEIGTVNRIELVNHDWVRIELYIQKSFQMTKNTAAVISTGGLSNRGYTGYVFIQLLDVDTAIQYLGPPKVDRDRIIPLLSTNSYSVDKTLKEVANNIEQITQILTKILDKNTITTFKHLLSNMDTLTYHLEEHDTELMNMLTNIEAASIDIKPFFRATRNAMLTLDQEFLPEMHETINNINLLSDSLLDLTSKLNKNPSILIHGITPLRPGPGEGR